MSDYYYKQMLNNPYLHVTAEVDGCYLRVSVWGLLSMHECQRQGRAHGPPGWLSPGGDRMVSSVGTQTSKFFPLKTLPTSHLFYQLLTRFAMCVGDSQAYKMIPRFPHLHP